MIGLDAGTLFLTDGGRLRTNLDGVDVWRNRTDGIIGFVATTGTCVALNPHGNDPRFNPKTDSILLGIRTDTNRAGSISVRARRLMVKPAKNGNRGGSIQIGDGQARFDATRATALICFPVRLSSGETIGVFSASLTENERPYKNYFAPDDVALLVCVSNNISSVASNMMKRNRVRNSKADVLASSSTQFDLTESELGPWVGTHLLTKFASVDEAIGRARVLSTEEKVSIPDGRAPLLLHEPPCINDRLLDLSDFSDSMENYGAHDDRFD